MYLQFGATGWKLNIDSTKEKSKLNFLYLHIPLFNMLFCTVYMKTKNKQKEL